MRLKAIDIKPCLFCGAEKPAVYKDDEQKWTVECWLCGGMYVSPTSQERAMLGWNNRNGDTK